MSDAGDRGEGTFRDKVHELLRESILDAAWTRASESLWNQVRIADIAKDVGVSRQTIYNEFGTKEQLSLAIFNRELEAFLLELESILRTTDRFTDAVRAGLVWMLEQTTTHRIVGRMVADARRGHATGLIPLLTVRSDRIVVPVRERITSIVADRWPNTDLAAAEIISDLYVRFVIGQVITPTDLDRDAMVEAMLTLVANIDVSNGPRA